MCGHPITTCNYEYWNVTFNKLNFQTFQIKELLSKRNSHCFIVTSLTISVRVCILQ